jgi:hypothetical protein
MALNTDLESYCKYKNYMIAHQQFKRLNYCAPSSCRLMEMFINITEDKFEAKEWEYIMHAFNCLPNVLKDIKLLFNSNERDKNFYIHYADKAVDINVIKSNNLQKFLKVVKNRTESLDLQTKHKIDLSPNEISRLIQRTHKRP